MSDSAKSWLDTALAIDTQQDDTLQSDTVVEEPVSLFRQFVSAVSSNTLKDIQPRLEFSTFVRDLCVKAPSVAKYLVQEILNHSRDDSHPEVQAPKKSVSGKLSSKRKKPDRTYQPPKPSKTQPDIPAEDLHGASGIDDRSVKCQPGDDNKTINQGNDSLMTEKMSPKYERDIPKFVAEDVPQDGVHGQSATNSHALSSTDSESALHPLRATENAIKQPAVMLDKAMENNHIIVSPPLLSEEWRGRILPEIDQETPDDQATSAPSSPHGTEPQNTTLPGLTPSTPTRQSGQEFQSPLSDNQTVTDATTCTPLSSGEVLSPLTEYGPTASPPDKVEMSLSARIPLSLSSTGQQEAVLRNTTCVQARQVSTEESLPTQDSSVIPSSFPSKEAPTLDDMVAKSVDIIYKMSRHQEAPREVHSRILASIGPSLSATSATPAIVERSDPMRTVNSPTTWSASTWIDVVEAGHTLSKKVTILNMIEWIGASEWHDAELQRAENAPPPTKRGKPRKRLTTIVLDKYLMETPHTTAIDSTEALTSNDNEDCLSSVGSAPIQKRILDAKRKRLNNGFHRGRTLRKLIQITSLGILFHPDIWSYAKASRENIDKLAIPFQADPKKMALLSILDEQVELLANEGRPDLARFFDSLESRSITPSEEVSSLRAEYGLEREPIPQGCLKTAIDQVVKGIGHVLGEHSPGNNDSIVVNGTVELSYSMLGRLRSKNWLTCWDITAALEMSDRLGCVKLGLSIPLHKEDAHGEVMSISNPFCRWRMKIDEYRCEYKNDLKGPQIYICPLNVKANHFTLLEINEQTKMIYHYDSMAIKGIIQRKIKYTAVRRVVEEEFKYLGFGYTEASTPQQKDEWSCGLMAIRNAKRRMIGLLVGTWDDEVDPDRVIKEVVGDCQTFLKDDALQPRSLSKKRKKIVEGLQSNIPEPSRSSKRLKR